MLIYKLYVKTHITYKGSGIYWKQHLKKHGLDHVTEVLRECYSKEELKEWGLYYSRLWNVVESSIWANLKEEQGDGGRQSEDVRKRIGEIGKGRVPWNKGKIMWNKEQRKQIGEANRLRGPQTAETIAKRVAKQLGRSAPKKQRNE